MIKVLIATSVIAFLCLLLINTKVLATTFTIWVTSVAWNMHLMFHDNNMNLLDAALLLEKQYNGAKKKGKRGEQFLYYITGPLVGFGMIMVIVSLFTMFIM